MTKIIKYFIFILYLYFVKILIILYMGKYIIIYIIHLLCDRYLPIFFVLTDKNHININY